MSPPRILLTALLCAGGVLMNALPARTAEPSYRIRDRGRNGLWVVALDELCAPGSSRPEPIAPARNLEGLLSRAQAWRQNREAEPALVLYPAGATRDEFNRRLLTDQVLVQVVPGVDLAAVAGEAGASGSGAVDLLADHYLLQFPEPGGALQGAERLRGRPGVVSAEPQLARQAQKKLLPNDTYFLRQWHLLNTGQNGGTGSVDLNVTNVWNRFRGGGIVIGMVDDGLAYSHPDLAANYSAALSYDFNGGDADPAPNPTVDFHGTAVSGLAAARGNNAQGVCGVAYEAMLAGLRLVALPNTDANEAKAILHSNALVQIKNNSWGAPDCGPSGSLLERPGPMLSAALSQATLVGRQGRGTIFVWAAGNGGGCLEDINYDGFANSIYVCPIGAVTDQGEHPDYSESGACLVTCTPSGSPGRQLLTTTDLPGNDGFNRPGVSGEMSDRSYTQTFAGTSAAAPLASGALALVLQANPLLNWRDVKEILLRSSTRVQLGDAGWRTNSASIAHHHQLGAGLLNAGAAVQLATNWPGLGPLRTVAATVTGLPRAIPDNDPTGLLLSVSFTNVGFRVEHVTVTLSTTHTAWGDLAVTLTSPRGLPSQLSTLHVGDPNYDYDNWTFSSVRHWGEPAEGTWTVRVADVAAQDVGTLDAMQVRLYGSTPEARLSFVQTEGVGTLTLQSSAVGWSYAIESSGDLSRWTVVTTLGILPTGRVTFTDTNIAGPDQRFYRARLVR